MKKYALVNGHVVSGEEVFLADVLIKDGKILAVGAGLDHEGFEVIDCEGKHILPGAIDVHVHFREPGHDYKEDWEHASRSAVVGGVTTVCDMPNNKPPIIDRQSLEEKRKLIEGRSYVNYGIYMGFNGENLEEINAAENIPAVKYYACDSTGDMGVNVGVKELFEQCNKMIVVHSEDGDIIKENKKRLLEGKDDSELDSVIHSEVRSVQAAVKSTERLCKLVEETGHRLHIAHMSTVDELEMIKEYRAKGLPLTCEVAPHHLFLSIDDYAQFGPKVRMNPPLRTQDHLQGLWKGLENGDVDMIATDHAPHTLEEKGAGFNKVPSGVPGVEFMLPLMLNEVNKRRFDLSTLVRLMAEQPSKIFNILNKGEIVEGADADVVVVDMALEKEINNQMVLSKCGWTPYVGMKVRGWPVKTFVNGFLTADNGEIVGEANGCEASF